MSRSQRALSLGMSIGIGLLVGATGAFADPNPGTNTYGLDPCVTGPPNGQCPLGANSYVHAPDPGVVGFDIYQPITGDFLLTVDGANAELIYSKIDLAFLFSLPGLGSIDTDIVSRIEGAVGTVVGNDVQWAGTQQFISNGTIDCQLFIGSPPQPACDFLTDYTQGVNVFVEGRNVTIQGPGPASPTPITLPDFPFSADGTSLFHTGEFNINKVGENNLFLALEATFVPEPGPVLMLLSGLLMLVVLDRRRAHALR